MDAEEELARARIGTAVGVWRLERLLGIGGMASVYAGRRSDGVLAAVKLLHPYWAEIGEVASFLLSTRASYVTGQTICVDGGATIV